MNTSPIVHTAARVTASVLVVGLAVGLVSAISAEFTHRAFGVAIGVFVVAADLAGLYADRPRPPTG